MIIKHIIARKYKHLEIYQFSIKMQPRTAIFAEGKHAISCDFSFNLLCRQLVQVF